MNKRLSKKTKTAVIIVISVVFVFLFSILFLRFSPYKDLEAFLTERQYSTRVYDCNKRLIQIMPLNEGLRREYTPLNKMQEAIKTAFITAEDKRFYKHQGIDFSAIFRALFQNISNKETVSGASTITMQLARIISPKEKRNIFAKITEAINALRLETRLSKDEILELYLNNVPFGFNTEGVTTAARTFYNKTLNELTENQIYTLSVIPRRPSSYNPLNNPEKCAERTAGIFNKDKEELLETTEKALSHSYPQYMPHYIKYLESQNIGLYEKNDIVLSANLDIQFHGEELMREYLDIYSENRISNGSIIVIKTQTGEILAWIGSGNFYDKASKGQIDGVLTPNQPGSSMKPFLYGLAIEYGYAPSTVIPDIPTDFGFEELYVPQNFNNKFNGPVRLRIALASSLNVPAVSILNQIGLKNYTDKLKDIGFYSLENETPGLGIALGNAAVSLYELVQGFSIFPRDGLFLPLIPFVKNEDNKRMQKQVYSKDTSRIICDMLSDASSRATGFRNTKVFSTDFPSMFKTGTANQYQNITALAATPLYTVGVWMGNFDGETVVGKTGSSIPASIAKNILETIQFQHIPFKKPVQWTKTEICSLSGMKPSKYCPHIVTEYVRDTKTKQICNWHTEKGTEYPAIYNNWLHQKNRTGIISDEYVPLTIMSPKNNSIFYFDNNAGDKQKLFVEITGMKDKDINIRLENQSTGEVYINSVFNNFRFTVPVNKGQFTLTLKCEDEETSIDYTVN